jgi:hypothetical protein
LVTISHVGTIVITVHRVTSGASTYHVSPCTTAHRVTVVIASHRVTSVIIPDPVTSATTAHHVTPVPSSHPVILVTTAHLDARKLGTLLSLC